MTDSYATARAAYRELRSAIGPWAKANDYRRWAGTQAGWQKPIDAEQPLLSKFEGYVPWSRSTGAPGQPRFHDSAPVRQWRTLHGRSKCPPARRGSVRRTTCSDIRSSWLAKEVVWTRTSKG